MFTVGWVFDDVVTNHHSHATATKCLIAGMCPIEIKSVSIDNYQLDTPSVNLVTIDLIILCHLRFYSWFSLFESLIMMLIIEQPQ